MDYKPSDQFGIDIKEEEEVKEPQKVDEKQFYVCVIDESESVNIFSHKTMANQGRGGLQKKIKECPELPLEIRNKDLFGMGYPYYCVYYGKRVVCSSDFGVLLFEIDETSKF